LRVKTYKNQSLDKPDFEFLSDDDYGENDDEEDEFDFADEPVILEDRLLNELEKNKMNTLNEKMIQAKLDFDKKKQEERKKKLEAK